MPAASRVDGCGLHGADLSERGHATAEPVMQRASGLAGRPRTHFVTGESELLREQMTDVARADQAKGVRPRFVQPSRNSKYETRPHGSKS